MSVTESEFEKKENQSLLQYLVQIRHVSREIESKNVSELLDTVITNLSALPQTYTANNYTKFISLLEQDYYSRVQYQEYLVMDKIELLQAVELHKKTLHSLQQEMKLFTEYLQNARRLSQKDAFQAWISKQNRNHSLMAVGFNFVLEEGTGKFKSFS